MYMGKHELFVLKDFAESGKKIEIMQSVGCRISKY